jgi:hypothetical protein
MTAIAERPGPEAAVSPYLEGVFAPVANEIDAECAIVGELPDDLAGVLLDVSKQVSSRAGDYQVDGAAVAATLNIGGSATTTVSFVVGAEA